jgi:hypothetical protein
MRNRRVRRPSRFRRSSSEPQPRFQSGEVAGDFEILEYLGYSANKPLEPVRLRVEHHWYHCKCSCGAIEVHTQQQLIDTRRHRKCKACIEKIGEPA